MSDRLVVSFRRTFPGGATIGASLDRPARGRGVTALFGPSGCGKSTVLRVLAGLDRPQEGTITFAGEPWLDAARRVFVPARRRGVGYLFQDYALFPHLRVRENIAYPLARTHRNTRVSVVGGLLDRFELGMLAERFPSQLSGGQQQRVALARALASRPRLLLLDEPLSALDAPARDEMRRALRSILAELDIPVVLVTHDAREAISLADYALVMDEGVVLQQGPVEEVFGRPTSQRVARIVGVETVVRGRVVGQHDGLVRVSLGAAHLEAVSDLGVGSDVDVCVRAGDVTLQAGAGTDSSARNRLPARVTSLHPEGATVRVEVDAGFPLAAVLTSQSAREMGLAPGVPVTAVVKATAVHLVARG
jgi:molybdate transport system ATP-binding protein